MDDTINEHHQKSLCRPGAAAALVWATHGSFTPSLRRFTPRGGEKGGPAGAIR
eukprot:CAMPEP_0204348606 /NCGR_PEP_ID=MMETSP0469-20131031/28870_1 /ASSEMBLY_ACC=CAM_ASM_000384 /TAXON_ID=2969 /ORGANISM="Oxyrrhis marina" /LENGTH=52 /DNA_ID=CAMNT_0051334621 /DNA_START=8 /DNA_END=162 /DNA_ORIENTATION=+